MIDTRKLQADIEELQSQQEALERKRIVLEAPLYDLVRACGDRSVGYCEKLIDCYESDTDLVLRTETQEGDWDTFSYHIPLHVATAEDPTKAAISYRNGKLKFNNAKQLAIVQRQIADLQAQEQQLKGNPQ